MNGTGIFRDAATDITTGCSLVLGGEVLNIYLLNEKKDLLIWKISSMKVNRVGSHEIIVTYGSNQEQSITCEGEIAKKIEAINRGEEIPEIPKNHLKKSLLWISLLAVVFGISVCLFAWFYFIPWVAEKASNMVSVETEIKIGDQLSQMYKAEVKENDSANFYIQEFTNALFLDTIYPLKVNVIRSEEINAFAVPGGHIFVYSGILKKMESYKELVALLGHEVTHVQKRHSLKSICRTAASGMVMSAVLGDAAGLSSSIISQADKFKELDYSRDLETEADENGLRIMLDNKVSPKGMFDLLELLKKESGETPALMKYLSSHPETEERINNIKKEPGINNVYPENLQLKSIFENLLKNCRALD